jgi:hypothetical protein
MPVYAHGIFLTFFKKKPLSSRNDVPLLPSLYLPFLRQKITILEHHFFLHFQGQNTAKICVYMTEKLKIAKFWKPEIFFV